MIILNYNNSYKSGKVFEPMYNYVVEIDFYLDIANRNNLQTWRDFVEKYAVLFMGHAKTETSTLFIKSETLLEKIVLQKELDEIKILSFEQR